MSKVVHKNGSKALTVAVDQILDTLDMTNSNGVSVQLNTIAGAAGTMKLQYSNDNSIWEDIPSATKTLTANAANVINWPALYTAHVRVLVTLSAGAGTYNYFMLCKER